MTATTHEQVLRDALTEHGTQAAWLLRRVEVLEEFRREAQQALAAQQAEIAALRETADAAGKG
jgi:hypothetical protein